MIIHNCERALYHGRVGNRIIIKDQRTFNNRSYELNQMRAEVDNVATFASIWFDEIRSFDGVDQKILDKTYKWEDQIGTLTDSIIRLIDGVMRSDNNTFHNVTINDPKQ